MLSSPESKASVLKNSINTINNVNLVTGEYQISYSFPSFVSRGGASFTPALTYNPSYTVSRSRVYKHFSDSENFLLDLEDIPYKEPFSWVGNGWSLNPFGYIILEKVIKQNEAEDQYRLVLPDGTSSKLILIKKEYSSIGDLSVLEWNGNDVYITEYQLENNPYFLIKRYRTFSFIKNGWGILGVNLDSIGRTNIYESYKWFVQSPDNSKYYFTHANINKKVFSSSPGSSPFGPSSWTHYYPYYNKWDITKWLPNGNENNAVFFEYNDVIDHLNLGYDYYVNSYLKCKELLGNCEVKVKWYFEGNEIESDGLESEFLNYEKLVDTSYISESYPQKIYSQDTELYFDGVTLDNNIVYQTNFDRDSDNDWLFYCSPHANPGSTGPIDCSSLRESNLIKQNGKTWLRLQGHGDSRWGAYKFIDNLEPFSSYVIKANIEIPIVSSTPSINDCTTEDLLKTPDNIMLIGKFRKGYKALIKFDARSVIDNRFSYFDPKINFFNNKDNGGMFQFDQDRYFAFDQHDSYNINCWNWNTDNLPDGFIKGLGTSNMPTIQFKAITTFSTADETSKVLLISAYNHALKDKNNYIDPIITSLTIEKVPRNYYLNRLTYKKNRKNFAIFDLDYKREDTEYFNLDKIQELSFLPVPENVIPYTTFEYDKDILKKINLPIGGSMKFDTTTITNEYSRQDPWIRYGIIADPILDTNIHLKKIFTKVDNVRISDGIQKLTLSYDYQDLLWNDDKETFFAKKTNVRNDADNEKEEYEFYTEPKELVGILKKTTAYIKPSWWLLRKKVVESNNLFEVYKGYNIQVQTCTSEELKTKKDMCDDLAINSAQNPIYHIRNLRQISTRYDENGENGKIIETKNTDFDIENCDLPREIISKGFLDNSYDDRYTTTTYTTINNGKDIVKCLPQQISIYDVENTEKSRTTTSYYEDPNKIGLAKQTISHNLEEPSKNIAATFDYDNYRNQISIKDTQNHETRIAYDSKYNKYPVASTNPLGQTVSLDYDVYGKVIRFTDFNNNKKYFLYDDLDRLCKVQDNLISEPMLKPYDGTGLCKPFNYQQALSSIKACNNNAQCKKGEMCCEGRCLERDLCI